MIYFLAAVLLLLGAGIVIAAYRIDNLEAEIGRLRCDLAGQSKSGPSISIAEVYIWVNRAAYTEASKKYLNISSLPYQDGYVIAMKDVEKFLRHVESTSSPVPPKSETL